MSAAHILVVGGTRGIGLAVSRAFLAAGSKVTLLARRAPEAPDLKDCAFVAADLMRPQELPERLASVAPLDGLVALQRYRGEGDDWEGEWALSLGSSRQLLEHFGRSAHPGAGAVLVSSLAGRMVAPEQPLSYHVAKAGMEQMVRYYAATLGQGNLRVNGVALGAVLKEGSSAFYEQHPELTEIYARITPLGRMGRAEEVARAIRFLVSAEASFITGQILTVDGGLSLLMQEALARRVSPATRDMSVTRSGAKP